MAYNKTIPASGGSVSYKWSLDACQGTLKSSNWTVTQSQASYFSVTFDDTADTVQISASELAVDTAHTVTLTPKMGANSCTAKAITVTQQGIAPCTCNDLTLGSSTATIPQTGGSTDITYSLSCTTGGTVTFEKADTSVTWYNITTAATKVTISANTNSAETARTATVNIKVNGTSCSPTKTITVSQAGLACSCANLSVTESTAVFSSSGGTKEISYTFTCTNETATFEKDSATWYTLTQDSTNKKLIISASTNSETSARTATISSKVGTTACSSVSIAVSQSAATPSCPCSALTLNQPSPEPTPTPPTCSCSSISRVSATMNVDSQGGSINIYTLNESSCFNAFEFRISGSGITGGIQRSGNNVFVTLTENPSTGDDRTITITPYIDGSICSSKDVTINQPAADDPCYYSSCGGIYVDINGKYIWPSPSGVDGCSPEEDKGKNSIHFGYYSDCTDQPDLYVSSETGYTKDYSSYGIDSIIFLGSASNPDIINVIVKVQPYNPYQYHYGNTIRVYRRLPNSDYYSAWGSITYTF